MYAPKTTWANKVYWPGGPNLQAKGSSDLSLSILHIHASNPSSFAWVVEHTPDITTFMHCWRARVQRGHALYLGFVDEGTHVAHNPGSLLLGISRPVTQASVHHRHNEGQAGCIHRVDEDCLEQGVQRRLGVLVGVGNGQQQGLH